MFVVNNEYGYVNTTARYIRSSLTFNINLLTLYSRLSWIKNAYKKQKLAQCYEFGKLRCLFFVEARDNCGRLEQ